MKGHRPEAEPKPFALVPIPSQAPSRARAATHERFAGLTGRLDLVITVESEYLFVGSGSYEFDPNARGGPDVWHTFYRRNGQICIPGTSIKGAIRAIVEAISNSCVSQSRKQEQSVVDSNHRPCQFQNEKSKLCPACRLFGTTGFRGRVHFSDALPQGNVQTCPVKIAELWEPKRWEAKRRFYEVKRFQPVGNQRPERNFRFVEAVPKDTPFSVSLHFENLSEAELGLICHALGWKSEGGQFNTAFTPKLGGAKPRCFGAVKISPVRLRLWENNMLVSSVKARILEGAELSCFLVESLQACQKSVGDLFHRPSWEALVRELRLQSDNCPKEVY